MNIPINNPTEPDIYSFGFSKSLTREMNRTQSSVVYDSLDSGVNVGQLSTATNVTPIGGFVQIIALNDNLQAILDAISQRGGGIAQFLVATYVFNVDIYIPSNVTLIGAGRDRTVLTFINGKGLKVRGTANDIKKNIKIQDLTINGPSTSVTVDIPALDIDYADFITMDNLSIKNGYRGCRIKRSRDFIINNCTVKSNGNVGWLLAGTDSALRSINRFVFTNCSAESNSGNGFEFDYSNDTMSHFTLINCKAESNTGVGFQVALFGTGIVNYIYSTFLGCNAANNTGDGFQVSSNVGGLNLLGCFADSNGGQDMEVSGTNCNMIGCYVNGDYSLNGSDGVNIVASGFNSSATIDPLTAFSSSLVTGQTSLFTRGSTRTNRKTFFMQNTDGATLRGGSVVILKSTASGDEVATTTTNGDKKVFGVLSAGNQGQVSDTQWGEVLVEGYYGGLYVNNSLSSIAIGDYLSTYSHAYFAKKASTGEMVFAMALEAPTTSTAAIAALLISPRLI